MYVVTNREVNPRRTGLGVFGETPNSQGPNELRLVEVTPQHDGSYETQIIDGKPLTRTEVRDLERRYRLDLDQGQKWYSSLRIACELMRRASEEKRHLVVFVHGYNNDMGDVMATAQAIEALYNVIVVPFSWPANGGGPISGTAAYLDDKRDARVSMDALNRFLGKVRLYQRKLTAARRDELMAQAREEVGGAGNRLAIQERFAHLQSADCQVTLNLLCHSMGAYVLKYALRPRDAEAAELIFDNVSLLGADTNAEAHEDWVERIQVRNRLYIVINENDSALAWSRRKPGDEQRARLGHYLRHLVARNTHYIDVTGADGIGDAHGYYTGGPVTRNAALHGFLAQAFEGGRGEEGLDYAPDMNAYRLR